MSIGAEKIIIIAMFLSGAVGVVSFFVKNYRISATVALLTSFVVSVLTFAAVFQVLYGAPSDGIILSLPLFKFIKFRIHVDGISAIFLFLMGIILPFIFQYSAAYVKKRKGMNHFYSFAFLLTLSVYGLLVVADMFICLGILWQILAFSGWWLIKNGETKGANKAARNFFIWMQSGFVFVILGAVFLTMGKNVTGLSYFELFDFNTVSERMGEIIKENPFTANMAILMFLIGFGIKLGIMPFGLFWLADSYDSAPSPVSALFAAIVSKTGLYGLIRTFLSLIPENATDNFNFQIWGIVLGGTGAITLVIATWRALIESGIKRILAYSAMATGGLILVSLGVCVSVLPVSDKAAVVGAAAITGAFIHLINHGIVNVVLFINAGVILSIAGSRLIENIVGIAKYLPVSCLCGFLASMSAAGLPPLNGFTGKWFIYCTAVKSSTNVPVFAILSGIAILAGVATIVVFVKYFGSIYLSKPLVLSGKTVNDSGKITRFAESNLNITLPQIGLCFIALIFSIFPQMLTGIVTKLLIRNPHGLGKLIAKGIQKFNEYDMGMNWGLGYAPAGLFAAMAFAYSAAVIFSKCGGSQRTGGEPWLCGYQRYSRNTQYPASQLCHELINKVKKSFPSGFGMGLTYGLPEEGDGRDDSQDFVSAGVRDGNKFSRKDNF
jgi:formate hydrogenlyase subunit 3/multisubunit Na+/H+ antiporter MnhD subunit